MGIELEAETENLFRQEGPIWTFVFSGRLGHLPDTRGMHYLAHLLRRPGIEVPAVELLAATTPEWCEIGEAKRRDPRERARVRVTKGICAALRKIEGVHPPFARHLEATIKRGYVCRYLPDPRVPIHWEA